MQTQHFEGKPVSEESSRICVLFDPKDGRIVHAHGVTVLQSATPVEPAEMETRARRHAQHFGKSVDGLKALHLPLSAIAGMRAFKVNASGDGIISQDHALPQRRHG